MKFNKYTTDFSYRVLLSFNRNKINAA